MNPDQVDQHFTDRMVKKQRLAEMYSKLSSLEPDERTGLLSKAGLTEDDIGQSYKEQLEELEGKGAGETAKVPWYDDPVFLTAFATTAEAKGVFSALPLLSSMLFGPLAGHGAEAAGIGEVGQEIANFIGGLFSVGGEEAKAAEETVKLLNVLKEDIAAGKVKPAQLSIKFAKKLTGILKEPDDEELRLMKSGFISRDQYEELFKAQSRRTNRMNQMLSIYKKASLEEQDILRPKLADEFSKYIQLYATKVVEHTTKEGKDVYVYSKHAWSDADLKDLLTFASKDKHFPEAVDRVLYNPLSNEKGFVDLQLFNFAKTWLTTGNIANAEAKALLTNPRTPLAKAITDLLFQPVQRTAQSLAMGWQHKSLTAAQRSLISAIQAWKRSFPQMIELIKRTLDSGDPEFEKELAKKFGKKAAKEMGLHWSSYGLESFDKTPEGMANNWLASFYELGPKAIMSADQAAKFMAWESGKFMFAYNKALQEVEEKGVKGIQKYNIAYKKAEEYVNNIAEHPWLLNASTTDMYKSTFTDSGKLIQGLTDLARKVPFIRVLFPFIRTPLNLYMEGLRMTPGIGLGMAAFDEPGLERTSTIAKSMVGTLISGLIAEEVMAGRITGGGPTDPKHYNMKLPAPYTAYGFNYRHLGPFGDYLAIVSDATESYMKAKPEDQYKLLEAVGQATAKSLISAPMLDQFHNLTEAISAARKGDFKRAKQFFGAEVSGFIPAVVGDIEKTVDPVYRESYGVVGRIREKYEGLPGYRNWDGTQQYLPPGASPDDTPPSWWGVALNMINPVIYNGNSMDEVDHKFQDLGVEFSRIPEFITEGGKKYPLTKEQQDKWAVNSGNQLKLFGMNQRESFKDMINDPEFNDLSPDDQKRKIMINHERYHQLGRMSILEEVVSGQGGVEAPKIPETEATNPEVKLGE